LALQDETTDGSDETATVNPTATVAVKTEEATPELIVPPKPTWKLEIFAGDEYRVEEIELPAELEPAAATEEPVADSSRTVSSLWKSFFNTKTRTDERPPVLAAP
jgi:hypothetical protein